MSTTALVKEFERLAEENARLLHTEEGAGDSIGQSSEKAAKFDENLGRIKELKGLIEKANEFDVLQRWASTPERKAAVVTVDDDEDQPGRKARRGDRRTAGADLVESAEFKSWLAQVAPNGQISDSRGIESPKFQVKDLVTGEATSGGAFFQTDYTGLYVPYVQAGLTVRDLVINATTDADIVEFVRAVAHTNVAAETAEAEDALPGEITFVDPDYLQAAGSGSKPEGSFTWEKVTQAVQPIAEGVPVSRRSLMNAGQMRSIIDDQLRFDIAQRLNTQMIAGDGSAPNFRGIRNTVGIQTQAYSNNPIETLRKGKTKVSSPLTGSGKVPNGAVVTPTTMELIDLFRVGGSTTTDGPFLINPLGDQPRTLWGMRLVEEPGMTAARAVVGYFRDAVLWDRQQTTIEAFSQHKDFASRNLVYLLAEWWGAFGVLQPKSFCDCTITNG